jgi:hypothetical protein
VQRPKSSILSLSSPSQGKRYGDHSDAITLARLREMAGGKFGDMVKAVVDVANGIMAVDGELHADEEEMLLTQGSAHASLWGINIYPDAEIRDFIEFDSMINLRPSQANRSRGVDDAGVRQRIVDVVWRLVTR